MAKWDMAEDERKSRERHPALPTPMALVALIRGADDSAQGERLLRMWLEPGKGLKQSKMGEDENHSLTNEDFIDYVNQVFSSIVVKVDTATKQELFLQLLQTEITNMFREKF